MRDLVESLLVPLRAAVVSLLGLWLAWSWFTQKSWLPLVIVAAIIALAHICDAAGKRALPRRPVMAVLLMEFWILSPAMLAALASCAVVVAAVELQVPKDAPPVDTQLAKTLATALTTFLTSGFIAWAGDQNKSPVARRIKTAFERAYKNVSLPRDVERLVYSDAVAGIEGWSQAARWDRARRLAPHV